MPSRFSVRTLPAPVIGVIAGLFLLLTGAAFAAPTESESRAVQGIRAARQAGDLTLALRTANQVIKLAPQLAEAYEERAQVLLATGDRTGAFRDIDHAIELQPQRSGARGLRARWRMEAFDYEGAVADAALAGKTQDALNIHGEALMALGRYREAAEDYIYLRSGPFGPNTNARYPYAVCQLGLGDAGEAVKCFETDYADGALPDSRRLMILGLGLLGRYHEAEQNLADWIASADKPAPTDTYDRQSWQSQRDTRDTAFYLAATLRFAQGDFPGTVKSLDRIGPDSEQADYARLLRHLALLREKRPDEALKSGGLKDPWAEILGRFLDGDITEKDLLKAALDSPDVAERRRRECEAGFYAGQKRLAAGDDTVATLLFEKAVATHFIEVSEYTLATIALKQPAN